MKILTLILTIFLLTGCDTDLDKFNNGGYRIHAVEASLDVNSNDCYYTISSYISHVKIKLPKDFAQIGDYLVVSNNVIVAVKK